MLPADELPFLSPPGLRCGGRFAVTRRHCVVTVLRHEALEVALARSGLPSRRSRHELHEVDVVSPSEGESRRPRGEVSMTLRHLRRKAGPIPFLMNFESPCQVLMFAVRARRRQLPAQRIGRAGTAPQPPPSFDGLGRGSLSIS